MLQNARVTAFTVYELLRENQQEGGLPTFHPTQIRVKLLELAEKETERLIKRNKRGKIEKHLQDVELKLEKLQEFKYSVQ